jgi:hypothetical protein
MIQTPPSRTRRIFKRGNPLVDYIATARGLAIGRPDLRPALVFEETRCAEGGKACGISCALACARCDRTGFRYETVSGEEPDVLFWDASARHHLYRGQSPGIAPSGRNGSRRLEELSPASATQHDTVFTRPDGARGFLDRCRRLSKAPGRMSVVVPAWDRAAVIGRTVESLLGQASHVHQSSLSTTAAPTPPRGQCVAFAAVIEGSSSSM